MAIQLPIFSRWSTTVKEGLPPFLFFNQPVEKTGIPIFEFHRVEAEEFRAQLQYLIRNGYPTLSFSEFHERLKHPRVSSERAALLTFDDGWENQWRVAFPLLKELGQKAVFFVNPSLVSHGSGHNDGFNFFGWEEARTMAQSGFIEIHSHTMTHEQGFAGSDIIDFQHPLPNGRPKYPWLWSAVGEKPAAPLWGAPVYKLRSHLLGPSYKDDPGLRRVCLDAAERAGAQPFFKEPRWREKLIRLSRRYLSRNSGGGRWETQEEYQNFVRDAVAGSKKIIEEKVGYPCASLAFPWERGSRLGIEEARRAGYQAAFWGTEFLRQPARFHQDFFHLPRIQGSWIPSLPGEDRLSLWRRLTRRLSTSK